jgi:hypothetical protein
MAPPNNKSFSVRVVLPASGWLMMAKVLRLDISAAYFICSLFFAAFGGCYFGQMECLLQYAVPGTTFRRHFIIRAAKIR